MLKKNLCFVIPFVKTTTIITAEEQIASKSNLQGKHFNIFFMKIKLFFFLTLFANFLAIAQPNLVPNPSFELLGSSTNPNFPVQNWDRPPGSGTTPDAFHTTYSQGTNCTGDRGVPQNGMGYSYPKSGNGYVGFLQFYNQGGQTNSREYIQAQLTSPLQAGLSYRVGLFVKKSPRSSYATNHFGIYLSDTAIHQNFNLPILATPQLDLTSVLYDTTNWTLMQMGYTATGGESYITIGNFYPDTACNMPYIGQFDPWCWLNVNAVYHYVDSVFVMRSEPSDIDNEVASIIKLYPNPANDWLNLEIKEGENALKNLSLYDAMGRKMTEMVFTENEKQLAIAHLPPAHYFIYLKVGDKMYCQRFYKK